MPSTEITVISERGVRNGKYNAEVASYNAFLNATLNETEYAQAALAEIQPIQMPELPPVMR
jgi:hypothetical protein